MAHPGDSCNSGAECLLSTVCCATGGELTCPLIAQLFNSGPAALLEVLPEPGLPIVQASASFSAMAGCDAEILVRDRVLFADLLESQDRQRVLAPLEELGKEGAAGSQVANDAPYRLVYRGGDPLWVRDLGFTVSRSQSKVGYFICVLDVNARVQATSELANTSAAYSNLNNLMVAMADNLPEMLWAKDLEGRYTFANKAICDNLLHVESMSEVVGKTDRYFADRERRERGDDPDWNSFGSLCESSDEAVKQSGQPQQFDEFGNIRGKSVCLDVYKKPLFNGDGELAGTVGSAHDVTEQKKMEGALKRWETIFETTQEGIMLTDADAYIIDVNPAFTRITGFSQEDVKGKRPPTAKTSCSIARCGAASTIPVAGRERSGTGTGMERSTQSGWRLVR